MLLYPNIDPVAVSLGPLEIRWYGIMYVLGFLGAFYVCWTQARSKKDPWTLNEVADLLFYCALGVIFGGTLGYILFYDPARLLHDPLSVFKFWQPGRAFHGGLLGVLVAVLLFAHNHQKRILEIGDLLAVSVPIGLATGRLGNFLNQELWGRVTDLPWGMVFPKAGELPRHPSQLYEFFLEGVLLFIILYCVSRLKPREGVLTALFLILYGVFRVLIEFFREPDITNSFLNWIHLTQGQLLSLPMIAIGLGLLYYVFTRQHKRRTSRCNNI